MEDNTGGREAGDPRAAESGAIAWDNQEAHRDSQALA